MTPFIPFQLEMECTPIFRLRKFLSLLPDTDTLSSTLSTNSSAAQLPTPLGVSVRERVDSVD